MSFLALSQNEKPRSIQFAFKGSENPLQLFIHNDYGIDLSGLSWKVCETNANGEYRETELSAEVLSYATVCDYTLDSFMTKEIGQSKFYVVGYDDSGRHWVSGIMTIDIIIKDDENKCPKSVCVQYVPEKKLYELIVTM